MGNSVLDGRMSAARSDGAISKFYTSAAWIDGRAEQQLAQVAGWLGVGKIAALADLHPGRCGLAGCAVLANRIFPQLIGNDICCGMSLFQLDLPLREFKLERALRRIRALSTPVPCDQGHRLDALGLKPDLFASMLYLPVHARWRRLGTAVLGALPQGAFPGMRHDKDVTQTYVQHQRKAVLWACLNRQRIAERGVDALRSDVSLIANAPYNLLTQHDGGSQHRNKALALQQPQVLMDAQAAADCEASKGQQNQLHYTLERGNPSRSFKGPVFKQERG